MKKVPYFSHKLYSQMLKIRTLFYAKNSDIGQEIADTFLVDCKKLKKSEEYIGFTPGDRPEGRF